MDSFAARNSRAPGVDDTALRQPHDQAALQLRARVFCRLAVYLEDVVPTLVVLVVRLRMRVRLVGMFVHSVAEGIIVAPFGMIDSLLLRLEDGDKIRHAIVFEGDTPKLFGHCIHTESGYILPGMSEKRNSEESESTRLERLYRKANDPVLRTHLLMVWRMSVGDPIREVARMVGYSEKWTREIARRYEREGVEGLGDRRHGNPGAKGRALLDEEGQAELRAALLKGSPPGGGMWSGPKVASWIEQKRGLERVHAQRGWEYLRKVGHSPQVPRPSNAQGADSEEREAFKKSLR
jgi:transposase